MSTYLITGGTGNIGALVAKALTGQGHQVIVYDLMPNQSALDLVMTRDERQRTTVVSGDVLDREKLARTMKAHQVERVGHFAVAPTAACMTDPAHSMRVNIDGTNNVFEAALLCGARRVMYSSSAAVFGPKSAGPDGLIGNDAPYDPQTVYGACKVANEVAGRNFTRQFGMETIGLRYGFSYGPVAAGTLPRWIPELIEGLVRGKAVTAPRGSRPTQWCYVEDLVKAIVRAMQVEPCPPEPITLSGGESMSIDSFVGIVAGFFPGAKIAEAAADWSTPQNAAPSTSEARDIHHDPRAAKEYLGWEPTVGVREGIGKIVGYHKAAFAGAIGAGAA